MYIWVLGGIQKLWSVVVGHESISVEKQWSCHRDWIWGPLEHQDQQNSLQIPT